MKEKILSKLGEAKDSVELVGDNLPENFDGFESLPKLERDGIYKNIEFAIQNLLDICAIILKEEDMKVPASDKDMLQELKDGGVLDGDVVETIQEMRGFRNYLVHRYGKLEDRTAYRDIKSGLRDFEKIFMGFRNYLSKKY